MGFIWSRFAKSKQTMGRWAMSWNRPQSINPECHFMSPTEGTLRQNSLSGNGAKISGVLQPRVHLIFRIVTFRGGNDSKSCCGAEGKSQDSHSPAWKPWRYLVSISVSLLPAFFQFCVHYGKMPDGTVHGWTVLLARDNGTWKSRGCFLSLHSERFTVAGPGRSGHLGPRLAPNTPLTVPYSPG